jgi:uncharacterized protein (DUF488 family)
MPTLYTIGHSTRNLEELLSLLGECGVQLLVDVRRFPGSRRHPQFSRETLATALEASGIRYVHEEDLGGRRSVQPGSPNGAWRNKAFRGYADHMSSEPFQRALARLIEGGTQVRSAIMCAEAVPWRCHRNLIADVLVARGVEVLHILGPGKVDRHTLSKHARVLADGNVIYPEAGAQPELFD